MPLPPQATDPDFGRLAQRMKILRQEHGYSHEELAERAGLSRRGVLAMESGERNGNVRSWFRVAQALDVKFSDLMSELD